MRLIIDAALPKSLAELFRAAGHDAVHVSSVGLRHAPDVEIAEYAKRNGYAIVTADYDFADIRRYPPAKYHGIIVFDLPSPLDLEVIEHFAGSFIERIGSSPQLAGALCIVDVDRIRVRR